MFRVVDLERFEAPDVKPAAVKAASGHMGAVAWPTVIWAAAAFAGFVGTYVIGASLDSIALKALLGATVSAYFAFCLFSVEHEAAHNNIAGKNAGLKTFNERLGDFTGLVTLVCYKAFRDTHHDHHRYANDPELDPNFWVVRDKGWKAWMNVIFAFVRNRTELTKYSKRTGNTAVLKAYARHWAVVAVVAVALILLTSWIDLVLLWVLPAMVSLSMVFLLFAVLPHGKSQPLPAKQDLRIPLAPEPLQAAVTMVLNGHNYHLLHHAYPRVPFYGYAPLMRELERLAPKDAAEAAGVTSGAAA